MFVLHTSNRAENLIEHLVKILEAPQQEVFAKEVFLIQSQGMERWLSQQLAEKRGLWANFEYLFPARFFNDMSHKLGLSLEQDTFNRENLLWRLEDRLRDISDLALQPLSNYLTGPNQDRKRYQLAQQVAYLFDQYMFMRPEWLSAWQQNKSVALFSDSEVVQRTQLWQSALWRGLIEPVDTETLESEPVKHRGEAWIDAIKRLNTARLGDFAGILPERISVLGINTLSPLYLGFLQALSKHIQVHFYLLNPCQEFWAESHKSVKLQLNQQSTQDFSINAADDIPINSLLGMLGQQGRDFQVLLLEQYANEIEISSFDDIEPRGGLSLLVKLQNDILLNSAGNKDYIQPENDQSISIHACHTRMREIEVLKDQLTARFDADDELDLRDVVVMAPDIQVYLPYIDAIFDDIPYAVADRSLRQTNHLLDVLLRFFELSQSRLLWHEVLELVEEPVVREQFGLFEADMLMIRHWVEETRIRWGESAEHRSELGLGGFKENSWEAGLERLLMGYAVPTDDQFSDGILPYTDIEGSQAQTFGSFYSFYKLLKRARKQFGRERTLTQWLAVLRDYSAQLLLENNDLRLHWSGLRELFEGLAESALTHTQSISLVVFSDHLKSLADEQKTATGFMRGQLTFCSMLPMRAIPFSTIALLGMNEGEFPLVDGRVAFDLMDNDFRRGDRSRRADERYQFLEILISSRKQMLISYLGQSIKNNDEIPPSVVVSELLDTLKQYYNISQADVLTRHPLQAFSPRYFLPDSDLFSYSKSAAEVATALLQRKPQTDEPWWQGDLQERESPKNEMLVDLADLFQFFHHPQQYFMQKHLQLRLQGSDDSADESEVFELNNLDRYIVNQQWLERHIAADETVGSDGYLERLRAEGRWPAGPLGEKLFAEMDQDLNRFAVKILDLNIGSKREDASIDYEIGSGENRYRLRGELQHAYENGNLIYRFANAKSKDQLTAWLDHLIDINSPGSRRTSRNTYLMQMDGYWQFGEIENAEPLLLNMLNIYREAQKTLSQFITPAAFAWVEASLKSAKSAKKTPQQVRVEASNKALAAFNKVLPYDNYWQVLYGNSEIESLFESKSFHEAMSLIVEPLLIHKNSIAY